LANNTFSQEFYPTFKKGLGEDKLVPVQIGTSDTSAVSKSTAA